jgi:hypothetical protein
VNAERSEGDRTNSLGSADLEVAGFQLWIHGRQFPEATDPDDGNWLRVTAHCGAGGASVWVEGPILMTSDLRLFAERCEALYHGRAAEASLSPLEPNLEVRLHVADRVGHIQMTVNITPDHLNQKHELQFEIDQSYLPGVTAQCRTIIEQYPVR